MRDVKGVELYGKENGEVPGVVGGTCNQKILWGKKLFSKHEKIK